MGWNEGAILLSEIITDLQMYPNIDRNSRKIFYAVLLENFENHDCDVLEECANMDEAFDEALYEYHPEYYTNKRLM